MRKDETITIRAEALLDIVQQAVNYAKEAGLFEEEKWVSADRAKDILKISSNSYLSYLRSNGLIEYSQPAKKHILYNRQSLLEYIEQAKQKTF